MTVRLFVIDMDSPADVTGIRGALAACDTARLRRLAILTKVEGNAVPNDYSRELARRSLAEVLAETGLAERSLSLLSVGCEGVATPLSFLLADFADAAPASPEPRLALGMASSPPIAHRDRGSGQLIDQVADIVRAALADGQLTRDQAGLLLVKVPTVPVGAREATPEQMSMARGRAIGALGVGLALSEIARERISDAAIGHDHALMTRHAMTFAGPETERIEAIALGNRPGAGGDLLLATTMMKDIIDGDAIRRMLSGAGALLTPWGELEQPMQVPALFAKAGIVQSDRVRGARVIAHRSAWPADAHMRAALSGVLGSILGHTRFFVSGDPVHQAPPGGGFVAAILRPTPSRSDPRG